MRPLRSEDWPAIIRPGSRVFLGGGACVPFALVRSMLESAHDLRDIELVHIYGLGETPWIDPVYADVIRTNAFFLSPAVRDAVERGQADYTPCPMSEVGPLFRSGSLPLDVAMIQVSPPDRDGICTLGASVDVVKSAVRDAPVVVAQINSRMPRTCGDSKIPASRIDWYIVHDSELEEILPEPSDERHRAIGRYVAQLVEDGSTLQFGLGVAAEAIARELRGHRHLGVHSGIFGDALMDLVKRGVVDGSRKSYLPGRIIASHVLGSRKLYRFVDGNEAVELHPSEWVNQPARIARNDRMVAVNGAVEIDLTGQVVRDSSGHRFFGGIGALQDFVRGAGNSRGGRPIIALTSTSDDSGRSRIVTGLGAGSGVCTGRGDVHHVVTEYGVASLQGRSIRERVARLAEIAHPDHREDLLAGALERGWLPKFFLMSPRHSVLFGDGVESARVRFANRRLQLRPLHPSDMRALQDFFYSHDEETVRMRYGYRRERMSGESAYKLAAVDQNRDLALALFDDRHGRERLCAIGRYYLNEDGEEAEVAFVVHESMRGLGMAGFLLGKIAKVALSRGIQSFWAMVMEDNKAMAAVFRDFGGKPEKHVSGEGLIYRMSVARVVRHRNAFWSRKAISWEKR